jgi:hypothetical protein
VAARLVFASALIALSATPARGQGEVPSVRCDELDLEADEMTCEAERCVLEGSVALGCADMKLWADRAEVRIDSAGRFAGALAQGDVLVVEGRNLITCQSLFLGPDKVQARIDAATVRVRGGKEISPEGVPQGRDTATFSGTLERRSERRLHVDDATFTLCDCEDGPPSWEVRASSIDATLEDRATIYWPVVWINPFGIGTLVPITPPIPALSLPLTRRAMGFLPPELAFYEGLSPTIDVPFFVPLGESYDLTVAPGLRSDWVDAHAFTPPSRWGALRLGGRARYAPVKGTSGALRVQWTRDRHHGAAKQVDESTAAALGLPDPPPYEQSSPDWDLTHRLALKLDHRSQLGSDALFTTDAEWFSDDVYLRDFEILPSERQVNYVPSRAQLASRAGWLYVSLSADYLQRIDVTSANYSNTSYAEASTPQRAPVVRAHVAPIELLPGLHLDGDASFARYGALASQVPPLMSIGGGAAGLSYLTRLGPLRAGARAGFDSLWIESSADGGFASTAALASADLDLPLTRRFDTLAHVVTPRLSYRGVPYRDGPRLDPTTTSSEQLDEALAPIDERLRRDRREHQAMLTLEQTLWDLDGGAVPRATLTLSQPYDLRRGESLASYGELRFDLPGATSAAIWASYDLPTEEMRELGVRGRATVGRLYLSATYARWSPNNSRFLRSIYELEAPRYRDAPAAGWVHFVRGYARVLVTKGFEVSYGASYDLELPEPIPGAVRDQGFTEHVAALSYRSPCDCWAVAASATSTPDPLTGEAFDDVRYKVTIDLGGYTLGAE